MPTTSKSKEKLRLGPWITARSQESQYLLVQNLRLKRELKRKIKGLEKDLRLVTDLYHRAKADRDRIVSIIERICPNSICLPAKTVRGRGNIKDYWYVANTSPCDIFNLPKDSAILSSTPIDRERLSKLKVTLEKSRDFRHCIHLKVANRTEIAYYMSDFALEHFGPPYKFLANEIAEKFVKAFASKTKED